MPFFFFFATKRLTYLLCEHTFYTDAFSNRDTYRGFVMKNLKPALEYSSVFLEREEWSEWFTLDLIMGRDPSALPLDLHVPLLLLGIAEEPLLRFIKDLPDSPMLKDGQERLKECGVNVDFFFNIKEPWGFGGVLHPYHRPGYPGILEYAIPIPRIEKDGGECEACEGTATTEGMDCLHCMGTGRGTMLEWDSAACISGTLWILEFVLNRPDKQLLAGVNTERKQLLSLRTSFDKERHFIGATLSGTFSSYLRSFSKRRFPEVEGALKSVYLQMFPSHGKFGDFFYKAEVHENGRLLLDVPGDACGLYVDGTRLDFDETSRPMQLDCHNVDGCHQQLALLSGLAALCGMARKSLYR